MANPEHTRMFQEGREAWNRWRTEHSEIRPDLTDADFGNYDIAKLGVSQSDLEFNLSLTDLKAANLMGVDFNGANLRLADFTGANCLDADLNGANLAGAKLVAVNLSGAGLVGANLTMADLRGADLTSANLSQAYLTETDMTGAETWETIFGSVDLSTVRGLDSIVHYGPSIIGIDTIYLSKGNIPDAFLRGAGVPEDFITYMRSLTAHPIEFYSCFISYSSRDEEFARRLHADLQQNGVRCWFAPHDVKAGQKLHEQIDVAIRLYEKLLLILSPDSMNSEWVETEISKARKREVQEKRRMLFPLRLCSFEALRDWECFDADTGKDSAREIREYLIPDFSDWKNHDAFKTAFDRLLRDLKAR